MVLTQKDFNKENCSCGRKHNTTIRRIIIEPGCLTQLPQQLTALGYTGTATAVYDSNTIKAKNLVKPCLDHEIVLPAEGLHANEHGVQLLKERLEKTDLLVAVGSGTLHDIVRYCAAELKVPFISAPTAATVDGFASGVAAMTWGGLKKTMPAVAPELIVADLNIISAAPSHLALSGVGDILGKFICLADWKIAQCLTGEYYCGYIADLTRQAVDKVVACAGKLAMQNQDAYKDLMYALILSGVAMQLSGNSRPASGAEHHISHLLEMGVLQECDAMHGEKVGVASTLCAGVYHRLAGIEDITTMLKDYKPLEDAWIHKNFGKLASGIVAENTNDCLSAVTPQALADKWNSIREIIRAVPSQEYLTQLLKSLGAKAELKDIGIKEDLMPQLATLSPCVRNRLTLMRILRMLNVNSSLIQ